MPKLKCPRCGSTNTVPIVYGMPADNLFETAQRGEIELGGCCIEHGSSPQRICKACDYRFRTGKLAALLLSDAFKSFEWSIGGFFGIQHRLLIEPETGGYLLRYARNDIFPDFAEMEANGWDEWNGQVYIKRQYTPAEWIIFAKQLDRCEIIEWKRRYYNQDILDGTQWGIEIKFKSRRMISISGSNEYPPYWDNFLNLLRREVDTSIY